MSLLVVRGLRVELMDGSAIVDGVDLDVSPGEVLALVGESGSGKTTAALAMLGYTRPGTRITGGDVLIDGRSIISADQASRRRMRGAVVSYVPQDPATSLNPSMRLEDQLAAVVNEHSRGRATEDLIARSFAAVGLPSSREFRRRFPHQISGGQQQRVVIATSLVCGPQLVVLDEPTTSLDVVTQARILDEIVRLRREFGVGMVYVSHDLAVVAKVADRIAVMYAGHVVEEAPVETLLRDPKHPYSRGLLASIPSLRQREALRGIAGTAPGPRDRPAGCPFAPRCPQRVERCSAAMPAIELIEERHTVRCFEWSRSIYRERGMPRQAVPTTASRQPPLLQVDHLTATYRTRKGEVAAVSDVSFAVGSGERLALVGESGSGKTTIARCVVGLHRPSAGRIALGGTDIAPRVQERTREQRRRIQMVFQSPYDSLNPRHTVGSAIVRSAVVLQRMSPERARALALELLEQVRLPAAMFDRFPAELSGGERQRIAIARALAAGPELLICDEITSALDVSVQAAVLGLLDDLRRQLHLSLLYISHDLAVVSQVADRVAVLERGVMRETGPVDRVFRSPSDEYTIRLLNAAPHLPAAPTISPS